MISGNRGFTPLEMSSGVPGKRRSLTGFSIIEVTVAIVITLLICAVIIAISIGLRGSIGVANSTLLITERGRHAANRICMDIREATALLSSHGGYSTGDDTIVLQVPSIDSDGAATDIYNDFDTIIYTLNPSDSSKLLRIVDAYDGVSQRVDLSEEAGSAIDTLLFSSNGTGLSSVASKGDVKTITVKIITIATLTDIVNTKEIVTDATLRNKTTRY